jgi:hypothetical protein
MKSGTAKNKKLRGDHVDPKECSRIFLLKLKIKGKKDNLKQIQPHALPRSQNHL